MRARVCSKESVASLQAQLQAAREASQGAELLGAEQTEALQRRCEHLMRVSECVCAPALRESASLH